MCKRLKVLLACLSLCLVLGCSQTKTEDVYSITIPKREPVINIAGVNICMNNRKCSNDTMLPPEPCAQPYPSYYDGITEEEVAEGLLLQHPVSRNRVLCLETFSNRAEDCARKFQLEGYVLITDIPQQTANYDALRLNTYPTRRWRNGGEVVPRW